MIGVNKNASMSSTVHVCHFMLLHASFSRYETRKLTPVVGEKMKTGICGRNFESKVKRINGTFILSFHGKIFDSISYVEFELILDMLTVTNKHYHCVNLFWFIQ